MEEGSIVRVFRDFITFNEGELSVMKDDILQILQIIDLYWVKCQNSQNIGNVPRSHICPIDNLPIPIQKGHVLLVAEYDFNSGTEGDLSIQKGDIIIGHDMIDHDWTKGCDLQGHVGIFPTSFCWTPDADLLSKIGSNVSITSTLLI